MVGNGKAALKQHFAVIGLSPSASEAEVKKAYRKESLKAHPDHGGEHDEMLKVNAAYEAIQKSLEAKAGKKDCAQDDDSGDDGDDDEEVNAQEESEMSSGETLSEEELVSEKDVDSSGDFGDDDASEEEWLHDGDYGYGDLEETGGSYKVEIEDGIEIGVEEHGKLCGCDLDGSTGHRLLSEGDAGLDDSEFSDEGYETG